MDLLPLAGDDTLNRMRRVYKYLQENPKPQPRDRIMHWTGFPSPKAQPVLAYASFQNTVMRINQKLAAHGQRICGGIEFGETYWLEVSA